MTELLNQACVGFVRVGGYTVRFCGLCSYSELFFFLHGGIIFIIFQIKIVREC